MLFWGSFLFCLLTKVAGALSANENCEVPMIEGHLHLSSIRDTESYRKCQLDLFSPSSYIEFERYGGRALDSEAWMNFTSVGEPNITISFGVGKIYTNKDHIRVPTVSKLEYSMWLYVEQQDNKLSVGFSQPGSLTLSKITERHQAFQKPLVIVSVSTNVGMEQVIRSVQSEPDIVESPIRRKTIMELERRLSQLESEVSILAHEQTKTLDYNKNMHKTHFEYHEYHKNENNKVSDDTNAEHNSIRQSIQFLGFLSLIIVLIGIYISWRTYQRQKKDQRWLL